MIYSEKKTNLKKAFKKCFKNNLDLPKNNKEINLMKEINQIF